MKTVRYIYTLVFMTLLGMNVSAQQRNVLRVPDVTAQIGSVQLPVMIENTDEIVGAQFDLTLPDGVTASSVGTLSNRSDGHTVTMRQMGSNVYRVLLHSAQNRPLRGQSGVVMYLPLTIPNSYEEGSEHPLSVSNAVLGKSTGENVLTEAIAGMIRISKLPDLTVKNITCDKQTLTPIENLVVSWQVENIGELATSGGWSEQVSLVKEDGSQSKLIATTRYDDILDASGIVSRQMEVTIPTLLGLDGEAKLQVRIVPDNNTGESTSAQANNTQVSTNTLYINKLLTLSLSPVRVEERTMRIMAKVSRSGDWTETETFNISATNDSRISVPTSVEIPAKQSGAVFYLQLSDNDVLDSDSVIVVSVAGNGYEAVEEHLIIEDNEYPNLTLTASKSVLTEGETFQLTVTTSRVSLQPITVKLTSENSKRFTFPQTITIPAGETSMTIDIVAVDNDEIELQESIAFRVSADKYNHGECIVLLDDNDMPELTFTLSPEAVSESDGYAALFGVIKRTDNLDKRVTLKLSDDSNGLLTYTNQTIVMAKNQAEVQFNIGVTDNNLVDGNHVINVTATVYASSCDCSVSGDSKGNMTATVIIIDDDGPTLKIKPAGTAMLEGSEGNVFAISHNVQSDADVTIHISSDKDEMLEYGHELSIPAGQSSANLLVNVKSNDQQDDSSIAAFKAEANGYSLGTCWILITDQTLPDATISLYADKKEVEAEQTVLLRAVVKNVGNASLRSTTPVEISFSGRSEKVKLTVGKNVAVGDSAVIEYNYDLPAITGNHTFEATVNASGKVPELIYANNTSEKVGLSVISPFSVSAQADKDVYLQADSIYVTGTATGSAGKNAKIEVYFINEGSRQTVSVTSDDEGNYTAVWKPLSKQSGHFIVGACYPGSKATEEMDAFDVYGVQAKSKLDGMPFERCEFCNTETYSGTIIVTNPGVLSQTGLKVTPKAESPNCLFNYQVPTSIGAGESLEIGYTIYGDSVSDGKDWQKMPIEISTSEGSRLDYIIYYYVHPLKAKLQATKPHIETTITYGKVREYPVTIRNVGKTETGKITLALPNWIQAVTPSEMASLAQGDSTTILLRFIPTDAMKLNVRVSGHIGINCANGDGTSISFYLTPVSEEKGTLKVDVVDEYTYFTNEAPHVSKAKVRVKNPSTNEIVAEGETAYDGTFSAELPEGYYSVTVDADKHDSYANTVIVDPGIEKEEEVFLSYQAITYSWEVEETGVEDEYEIETIVKYETRVPKPVVIITLPDEQPEPNSIIPVILTNKGLVNAVDVNLSLSISNGYTLEFLNDPSLEVLAPQQSHVFYAKMVPEADEEEAAARVRRANSNSTRCFTLIARAKYKELCQKYTGEELAEQIKKWGTQHCVSSGSGGGTRTSGGYGPGYPGNRGNNNYDSYYRIWDTDDPAKFCDKVLDKDDEEEPEESPCDEKPTLNYKLVSTDSNRYEMKGVAADGVSQVKIVLGKGSSVPSEDCNYSCHWSLSENIGTLENEDSWNNVIYTAPEDYPSNKGGHSFRIQAKMSYTNGEITGDTIIDIEVARVPLVLLHGLNSNEECWRSFADKLISEGLYEANQIDRSGYEATNCRYFTINMGKPQKKIENLIHSYKYNYQIVATKADLVGHSMGGILSRLHVQYVKSNNVHKVITVNTPHSGSELGDIVDALPFIVKETICKFKLGGFSSTEAISDLAVDSYAIDNFLNNQVAMNKMAGIPVHAVVTEASKIQDLENVEVIDLKTLFEYGAGKTARVLNMSKNGWLFILQLVRGLGYDDINEVGASDYVVSVQSQKGGLPESNISFVHGPWHCGSPDDSSVQSSIQSALTASVKSNLFSLSGFHPVDRKFSFKSMQKVRLSGQVSEATVPEVSLETDIRNDSLFVLGHGLENITNKMIFVRFNNDDFCISDREDLNCLIPSTHKGNITAYAIWRDSVGEFHTDSTTVYLGSTRANLLLISSENLYASVNDSLNVKLKCLWSDGTISHVKPESINSSKGLFAVNGTTIIPLKTGEDNVTFSYNGLTCTALLTVFGNTEESNDDEDSDDSPSICSTVTLSFKQKNVMTRQAFRGTLTVNNGNETTAMKDVKMNLEVRDMDGNLTTSHEFQIDAESLNGFTGNLDFTSGWTLEANGTGVATILFIPTKYAAPTEPKDYSFGGSFSYTDPYTGLTVTRDLNPVTLTVNPSPNLEMTYFMQRDVFGDDPLTETVEPMIPSEFALIVNNKGYGDAEDMNLTTHQPEIIDNQKGLAISFELISTQLNGGDKNLSLGGSMTSDFGTIPAHSQAYAQWWLQSSLLGHFIEYDVKATHLTSRNNPDLSLLDTVTVHELIHGFTVRTDGDKPLRGFLVNDIKDREDLPDEVYFTDATQQGAYIATSANIVKQSDTEFVLNVTAGSSGWNYGSQLDPTYGKQKLVKVTRADGIEVNVDNIWQTSCTLRDGKDPLYEKRLHFVGNMSADGETFYLTFEPKPELELEVESYAGVPEEGTVLKEQLTELTVKFNKPINAESFTTEDITINCQGSAQDASLIGIEKLNEQEFKLTLNEVTLQDGYYVLTVQTAGIEDTEGFYGSTGKQATWLQFVDGKVSLAVSASPAEGGTVTPTSGRFDYDSNIVLKAVPAEGYDFVGWTEYGKTVSSDAEYTHHLIGNTSLTAQFAIKHYTVNIGYDLSQGVIEGAASGIYPFGTLLQFTAVPFDSYVFSDWVINDEISSKTNPYTISVDRNMNIKALFVKQAATGIELSNNDVLRINIAPIPLGEYMYITGNFKEIRQINIYNMQGIKVLNTKNVQQGVSVGRLNAGIYYVNISTEKGNYRAKVLKR